MSQPFAIVMETARIMKESYDAGFKFTSHPHMLYKDQYITFYGKNEDGGEVGVEYNKEDSIDKKNIDYLMGVLNEIQSKNSKYDDYWGY